MGKLCTNIGYNLFRYHQLQIAFIYTDIMHKIAYNVCNYRYHGIYLLYKLRALYTEMYYTVYTSA